MYSLETDVEFETCSATCENNAQMTCDVSLFPRTKQAFEHFFGIKCDFYHVHVNDIKHPYYVTEDFPNYPSTTNCYGIVFDTLQHDDKRLQDRDIYDSQFLNCDELISEGIGFCPCKKNPDGNRLTK